MSGLKPILYTVEISVSPKDLDEIPKSLKDLGENNIRENVRVDICLLNIVKDGHS